MGRMDHFRLTMAVALDEYGGKAVGFFHANNLVGDDGRGLIPADPLELAFTAVLGMAFSLGVPVDTLHRVKDSVARIDARLICICIRRNKSFEPAFELATASLDCPGLQVFLSVLLVVLQRANADDFIALHVDLCHVGTDAKRVEARPFVNGLVGAYRFLLRVVGEHLGIQTRIRSSAGYALRCVTAKLIHNQSVDFILSGHRLLPHFLRERAALLGTTVRPINRNMENNCSGAFPWHR